MAIFRSPLENIAKAEARIAELDIERQAKIDAGDDNFAAVVARIDAEIASVKASILIFRQREEAMERRARQQAAVRAEQERLAGVASVRSRLTRRHEAGRKLDAALAQVHEAFAELLQADGELFNDWPTAVSDLGRLHHFRIDGIEPLSARRSRRPLSGGLVRSIAEHPAFNFADTIEARNSELVEMISSPSAEGAAA